MEPLVEILKACKITAFASAREMSESLPIPSAIQVHRHPDQNGSVSSSTAKPLPKHAMHYQEVGIGDVFAIT